MVRCWPICYAGCIGSDVLTAEPFQIYGLGLVCGFVSVASLGHILFPIGSLLVVYLLGGGASAESPPPPKKKGICNY